MSREPALQEYHGGNGGSPEVLGALAELTAGMGTVSEHVSGKRARKPVIPWEACHPVGPNGALVSSGTFDVPDLMGPHDPYWWDLRKFAAWGFTAGSVAIYKNSAQGEQIGSLAAPGNITWSTQELMAPRDRIIVVATSITGTVQFVTRAIEVETAWLPEYLM